MKKTNKNIKRLFVAGVNAVQQLSKNGKAHTQETHELVMALEAFSGARDWNEVVAMAFEIQRKAKGEK